MRADVPQGVQLAARAERREDERRVRRMEFEGRPPVLRERTACVPS